MQLLTSDQFEKILAAAPIKPRFKRDLKFIQSTERIGEEDWAETELLAIWNKSKTGGIVLAQPGNELFMIPFDASKHTADKTGRSKPVICDLCYTWQPSSGGGFTQTRLAAIPCRSFAASIFAVVNMSVPKLQQG